MKKQEFFENGLIFKNYYHDKCDNCGKKIRDVEIEDEREEPETPIYFWNGVNTKFMHQVCSACFQKYLEKGIINL